MGFQTLIRVIVFIRAITKTN